MNEMKKYIWQRRLEPGYEMPILKTFILSWLVWPSGLTERLLVWFLSGHMPALGAQSLVGRVRGN